MHHLPLVFGFDVLLFLLLLSCFFLMLLDSCVLEFEKREALPPVWLLMLLLCDLSRLLTFSRFSRHSNYRTSAISLSSWSPSAASLSCQSFGMARLKEKAFLHLRNDFGVRR